MGVSNIKVLSIICNKIFFAFFLFYTRKHNRRIKIFFKRNHIFKEQHIVLATVHYVSLTWNGKIYDTSCLLALQVSYKAMLESCSLIADTYRISTMGEC